MVGIVSKYSDQRWPRSQQNHFVCVVTSWYIVRCHTTNTTRSTIAVVWVAYFCSTTCDSIASSFGFMLLGVKLQECVGWGPPSSSCLAASLNIDTASRSPQTGPTWQPRAGRAAPAWAAAGCSSPVRLQGAVQRGFCPWCWRFGWLCPGVLNSSGCWATCEAAVALTQ